MHHAAISPQTPPAHRVKQRRTRYRQGGSVLVAVLAIILLITFMVTRFMDEAVADLEYRALFNEPTELRAYAYSMLEVALATIHEVALIDDGTLYAGEQGWHDPLTYAAIPVPNDWTVRIAIRDEGGKLPINTMSQERLNRLLEDTLGFDFGTARELSSTLLDWIDADDRQRLNGAESDYYLAKAPAYRAANSPLQSLDELRLLKVWIDEFFDDTGAPNERFAQLSKLVSVLNKGAVNLNAAPAPVLNILALESGWQDAFLFDGLDQPYLKQVPSGANSGTSGVEIGLLRVTVQVQRGTIPFTISALVEPDFNSESAAPNRSGNLAGASAKQAAKTGSRSEQDAIRFPFKIRHLSEYSTGGPATPSARHTIMQLQQPSK